MNNLVGGTLPGLQPPASPSVGQNSSASPLSANRQSGAQNIHTQPVRSFSARHEASPRSDTSRILHTVTTSPGALGEAQNLTRAPETGVSGVCTRSLRAMMDRLLQKPELNAASYRELLHDLQAWHTTIATDPALSVDRDLVALLETATQRVLFAPLTEAFSKSLGTREDMILLEEQCVELINADTTDRMQRAGVQLFSLLDGITSLSSDAHDKVTTAITLLNAHIEFKFTALSSLEQHTEQVQILEQSSLPEVRLTHALPEATDTTRPSVPLADVYAAISALREPASDLPFLRLFMRPVTASVDVQIDKLNALSAELRTSMCAEASRLADTSLEIQPDSTDIQNAAHTLERLMELLEKADSFLHPADATLLGQEVTSAVRALQAGEVAAKGNALYRGTMDSFTAFTEQVVVFQKEVATLLAAPDCSERAAAMLTHMADSLEQRLETQKKQEQVSSTQSLETVSDLLAKCAASTESGSGATTGRLARQLLSYIQDLKNRAEITTTTEDAALFVLALSEAESRAHVYALTATIAERTSLRTGVGELRDVYQQIMEQKTLSAGDRKALLEVLVTASASQRERLEQGLEAALARQSGDTDALPSKLYASDTKRTPEFRIRHLRSELESLRAQAQRSLLGADMDSLFTALDKAATGMADDLLALVRNNAAVPLLSTTLSQLAPEQQRVFQELCLKTWSDPVFMLRLDARLTEAGTASFITFLDTLGHVWRGNASPEVRSQAVAHIEELTLYFPELDALSLTLEKSCIPPEEHALLTQQHGSERGKRELGRIFAKERGTDRPVDNAFLQRTVQALQGGKTEEFDLHVLKVAWHTYLAAEKIGTGGTPEDFAVFQQTLPTPYRSMDTPLLSALMNSGLSGSASAHAVASVLASASKALGGSGRATEIFHQICHEADRYRAETILTVLVRNLLEAQSVTGTQGLEVGGALRAAIDRELRKDPSLKDRLVDKVQGAFSKDPARSGSFDDQLTRILETIPGLRANVMALLERESVLGAADEVLAGYIEEHARNLTNVHQKGALIPAEAPGAPPSVYPEKLYGEQLCVGLLALNDILSNPDSVYGQSWREQKAVVDQLDFQKHFHLDGMRGLNWRSGSDSAGVPLKKALEGLRDARTSTEFEYNKAIILGVFKEYNLLSKSEAILFFKAHGIIGGASVLQRALTRKHRLDQNGTCSARMQKKYATLRGSGARAVQAGSQSVAARAEDRQRMGTLIDAPMNSLSTHVARVMNTAVHLAVLDTFTKTSCTTFAEFLGQLPPDRSNPDALARSAHFIDCRTTLERKLGIPPEFAEASLISFFKNAKADFPQKLAADSSYDFALALRRFGTSLEVNGEVKSVMAEDKARTAATNLMQRLAPNQSIGLNLETGVTLSASVSAYGQLDFRATLAVAKENGLCAWRGTDGKPHLTLCKGFSGQMGISVDGILGTVAAKAHARVNKVSAGEMTFTSDAAFANFMGELFSGKAGLESLRHCENIAYSSSISATGEAILTTVDMSDFFGITAGVAEFVFEAKAGLTKTWTEILEGDRRTVKDAILYNLGLTAQLGLLGKDYIQMVVDPAIDIIGRQVSLSEEHRDKAHTLLENTGIKAAYSVAVTKTSTKIFDAGKLSGAETTRSSRLTGANPRSEAEAVLASFALEGVLRDEVLQGVDELHAEGAHCTLAATWTLAEAARSAWHAAPNRTVQDQILAAPEHYEVTEVSLRGIWNAVENNTWLGGLGQSFSRNANGTLSRELTFSPGGTLL